MSHDTKLTNGCQSFEVQQTAAERSRSATVYTSGPVTAFAHLASVMVLAEMRRHAQMTAAKVFMTSGSWKGA
jgi:hypothetical protein